MTQQHTPGPWKYQNDIEMVVSNSPEWNQSGICKIASGEALHDEANARLIAAAPELLDALQVALEYMERHGLASNGPTMIAKAAISKALNG